MSWISIIDKTPKEGEIVLTYQDNTEYPDYNYLVLRYEDWAFMDVMNDKDDEDCVYLFVTHWQPLPEKP